MHGHEAPSSTHETDLSPKPAMEFSAEDVAQATPEDIQVHKAEADKTRAQLMVGKEEHIDDARRDVMGAYDANEQGRQEQDGQLSAVDLHAHVQAKYDEYSRAVSTVPKAPTIGRWGKLRMAAGLNGLSRRQRREHAEAIKSWKDQTDSLRKEMDALEGKVRAKFGEEQAARDAEDVKREAAAQAAKQSESEGLAQSYADYQKRRGNEDAADRALDLAAGSNKYNAKKLMDRWKEYAARGDYDGFTSEESIRDMMKIVGRDANDPADYVSFLHDMNDVKKYLGS